jgi:hypothetical protein
LLYLIIAPVVKTGNPIGLKAMFHQVLASHFLLEQIEQEVEMFPRDTSITANKNILSRQSNLLHANGERPLLAQIGAHVD